MKKLLIAILFTMMLASCSETFNGNYGVVQEIELCQGYAGQTPKYKYKVTVSHKGDMCDTYELFTNDAYTPGDTLEIRLKPKYVPEQKIDTIIETCQDSISK